MAMIAIAGDDTVPADLHRRLQADGNRFLADVEMAKAANQPEPVELPRPLLETADQQHLLVEVEQLLLGRLVALRLTGTLAIGLPRRRHRGGGFAGGFRHLPLHSHLGWARYRSGTCQRAMP